MKGGELRFAFGRSVPVMLGYLFLGVAFGLMLQDAGYHALWAFAMSLCVYAGSLQFLLVTLLSGGAGLLYTAVMTLMINGRHIFYGLSFVEKFRSMGGRYPYMVFSLTDETYSLLCGTKVPEGMDEDKVLFLIAFLDQCYWITGSVAGALFGQWLTMDTTGIDFSMTALFVAIAVEQWKGGGTHIPAVVGLLSALSFLLLVGPERFILPSLAVTVLGLILFRPYMAGAKEEG